MTLIVEDGTGLSNAEAYCAVAFADARHAALGNSAWAALDNATKEQRLRRGAEKMTQDFRERWKGQRTRSTQALDWPRRSVRIEGAYLATNAIPAEIKNANADLALKASTDLTPDADRVVIREKLGPLETEYDRYGPQATRFTAVALALAPFLASSGGMVRLVR